MFDLARSNNRSFAQSYNPFREMEEFERRFFGDAFNNFMGTRDLAEFKADIVDAGDHYTLEADLPGFSKENIHLNLVGDTLTIQAERSSKREEKDQQDKLVRCERSYGAYTRQFDVSGIDTERIQGKYEDGVLTLTLPKQEPAAPASRRIALD